MKAAIEHRLQLDGSCLAQCRPISAERPRSASAELFASVGRQVSELTRPLSDRTVETPKDRLWPEAATRVR